MGTWSPSSGAGLHQGVAKIAWTAPHVPALLLGTPLDRPGLHDLTPDANPVG